MSFGLNANADGVSGALQIGGSDVVKFGTNGITTGLSHRNKLINGNFAINQRAVSGTVVLAAGEYGHDRFKAGAGGCTYTFATSNNITTLTISAGTLMQVIEGANLLSGTHTLSWVGTAQGRIDSGSYGASGVQGTAVGGTNQTCEWGTGTLSRVQYEPGTVATVFEHRHVGAELALCQRYYEIGSASLQSYQAASNNFYQSYGFRVSKRASATLTIGSPTYFNASGGFVLTLGNGANGLQFGAVATALGACQVAANWTASAEL